MRFILVLGLLFSTQILRAEVPFTTDGIPPLPPELGEKLKPYTHSGGAGLLGWDAQGMIVLAQESERAQIYRVVSPMSRLQPLPGAPAGMSSSASQETPTGGVFLSSGAFRAWIDHGTGSSRLFVQLSSATATRKINVSTSLVDAVHLSPDRRWLGFTVGSYTQAPDVFALRLSDFQLVRWTAMGRSPKALPSPERVHVRSFDGLEIPCWYFRPSSATTPAPLLIRLHGGPDLQALPAWDGLLQFWVQERGIAVLLPDVRGSSGYGATYAELDNGVRREGAIRDVGTLLEWASGRTELDAKRIGLYGESYGGFLSLSAAIRYPEKVHCVISAYGISHLVTFLERLPEALKDDRRREYGDERDRKMRRFLTKTSPLAHAGKIRIPLFVYHSADDPNVPFAESEQMVRAVRATGQNAWFLKARDEGHGFTRQSTYDYYSQAATLFLEAFLIR